MNNITLVSPKRRSYMTRLISTVLIFAIVMSLCCVVGLADDPTGNAITNAVKSVTKNVWLVVKSIVLYILAIGLTFQSLKVLTGNEKDLETAKKRIIWMIVGTAGVYFAPSLVSTIGGWMNTTGEGVFG